MASTYMNIGGHIAALRKARGLTQEQLAAQLGVSAPAVSKWETNSSCPDITLLCPLARALGTNVDTLLQFEESLSDQEVAARINEVAEAAMAGDTGAEERLEALFSPGLAYTSPDVQQAMPQPMRRMLLQSITGEEKYRPLLADPVAAAALDKLKASV